MQTNTLYPKVSILKEVNVTASASTDARISNDAVQTLLGYAKQIDANFDKRKPLNRVQAIQRKISYQFYRIAEAWRFYRNNV